MEEESREFSELRESEKSLKHNLKDPLCYLRLHGTVVSPLSLTQEVVGSRLTLFTNIFANSVDSTEFI